MFEYIYEWIMNVSFYLILMTALVQVLPSKSYKKYVQFYVGLVVVLMLLSPMFKILGLEDGVTALYYKNTYRMELDEIEDITEYLNEVQLDGYLTKQFEAEVDEHE